MLSLMSAICFNSYCRFYKLLIVILLIMVYFTYLSLIEKETQTKNLKYGGHLGLSDTKGPSLVRTPFRKSLLKAFIISSDLPVQLLRYVSVVLSVYLIESSEKKK